MEYKAAIIKTRPVKMVPMDEYDTVEVCIEKCNQFIRESKIYQVESEFQSHLEFEIMNMCNMLHNEYHELGFMNKENTNSVFINMFKKHIKLEKIIIDDQEDDQDNEEL
jgi:hypothetical protein